MPHKRLLFRSEAREKVLRGATASWRLTMRMIATRRVHVRSRRFMCLHSFGLSCGSPARTAGWDRAEMSWVRRSSPGTHLNS